MNSEIFIILFFSNSEFNIRKTIKKKVTKINFLFFLRKLLLTLRKLTSSLIKTQDFERVFFYFSCCYFATDSHKINSNTKISRNMTTEKM